MRCVCVRGMFSGLTSSNSSLWVCSPEVRATVEDQVSGCAALKAVIIRSVGTKVYHSSCNNYLWNLDWIFCKFKKRNDELVSVQGPAHHIKTQSS